MKFDLFSVVIGMGSLAAFIVPFFFLHYAGKKKSRRNLRQYLALAQSHGLNISDKEEWNGQYTIGIDRSAFKLFYLQIHEEIIIQEILIDLKALSRCEILNKSRVINNTKLFERLGLVFKFRSVAKPEVILDFYSSDGSLTLNGELQLLNKWQGTISELLSQ